MSMRIWHVLFVEHPEGQDPYTSGCAGRVTIAGSYREEREARRPHATPVIPGREITTVMAYTDDADGKTWCEMHGSVGPVDYISLPLAPNDQANIVRRLWYRHLWLFAKGRDVLTGMGHGVLIDEIGDGV